MCWSKPPSAWLGTQSRWLSVNFRQIDKRKDLNLQDFHQGRWNSPKSPYLARSLSHHWPSHHSTGRLPFHWTVKLTSTEPTSAWSTEQPSDIVRLPQLHISHPSFKRRGTLNHAVPNPGRVVAVAARNYRKLRPLQITPNGPSFFESVSEGLLGIDSPKFMSPTFAWWLPSCTLPKWKWPSWNLIVRDAMFASTIFLPPASNHSESFTNQPIALGCHYIAARRSVRSVLKAGVVGGQAG